MLVAAAWELNERLIYHTQPGRMLAGLNYDSEGTLKIDGEDDLPLLQPWSFQLTESAAIGNMTGDAALKNQPVMPMHTLTFRLATSRNNLFFKRNPTDNTVAKGLMEWVALIGDAIETTADGNDTVDAGLAGTCEKPLGLSINETETSQRAFHCFLEITLHPQHHCRGQRSAIRGGWLAEP